MDYTMNSRVVPRIENRDPYMAPQGCYRCRGEDKWVVLSVRNDAEWRCLCQALGRPELADDPRFAIVLGRHQHHDEIDRIITAWTEQRDHDEVMSILLQQGIPAGAVLNAREVTENPSHRSARKRGDRRDSALAYGGLWRDERVIPRDRLATALAEVLEANAAPFRRCSGQAFENL